MMLKLSDEEADIVDRALNLYWKRKKTAKFRKIIALDVRQRLQFLRDDEPDLWEEPDVS